MNETKSIQEQQNLQAHFPILTLVCKCTKVDSLWNQIHNRQNCEYCEKEIQYNLNSNSK